MNPFFQDHPTPLVIAHRGSCAHAPENTLAAFTLAAEQGADAIELDVTLTRDGQIVVIHDDTLERTTDGTGRVDQLTYDEVRCFDAGAKFNATYAGERVPLLDQVIEAVGARLLINVELKSTTVRTTGLESKVVETLRRHNFIERVIVSSFNPLALVRVKRLEPRLACGLLYSPDEPFYLSRAWLAPLIPNLEARHPAHELATAETVKQFHARGQRVNVWTIRTVEQAQAMLRAGVDGLIGDDPVLIRKAITRNE